MDKLPDRASLKGLPQELRDEIFAHAFEAVTTIHLHLVRPIRVGHHPNINLLLLDKQIFREVKHLWPTLLAKVCPNVISLKKKEIQWVYNELYSNQIKDYGRFNISVHTFSNVSSMMPEEVKQRIESIMLTTTLVFQEKDTALEALTGNYRGFSYIRKMYLEEAVFWPGLGKDRFNEVGFKLTRKDFGTGLGRYLEHLWVECPPRCQSADAWGRKFKGWVEFARRYYENGMTYFKLSFLFESEALATMAKGHMLSMKEWRIFNIHIHQGFASGGGVQLHKGTHRFAITLRSSREVSQSSM